MPPDLNGCLDPSVRNETETMVTIRENPLAASVVWASIVCGREQEVDICVTHIATSWY